MITWSEGSTSYVQVFWAWGFHLGEALEKMRKLAKMMGVENPSMSLIDLYEYGDLPDGAMTEDGGTTYASDTVCAFPTEKEYILPYGVIHSSREGEYKTDEITPGFTISEDEEGLIELEAVIEESKLLNVYLDAIGTLSDVCVFWVKIHDDWENIGRNEIYVNEKLVSQGAIGEFLKKHKLNTLQNGYVTLTTYSRKGQTNLSIDDHKMIVALSYDKDVIDRLSEVLRGYGLEMKQDLISVQYGFHHWHYHHPEARNRSGLVKLLKEQGFVIWKPQSQ